MIKFLVILVSTTILLFTLPPSALSNTVTIVFDNIRSGGIEVSGFDLYFFDPSVNPNYGWPPDSDFDFNWYPGQPAANWLLNEIPASDNKVRGIVALDILFNPASPLFDGKVLKLASFNTIFGINPQDSRNIFFDYGGTFGNEIPGFKLSESWTGNDQTITVSVVPDPPTAVLLGCGLIGLVVLRRRGAQPS